MKKSNNFKLHKLVNNRIPSEILGCIRKWGPISRARLAENCGVSRPAITRTVSALLQQELLVETALSDSKGPRRKDGLVLNPEAGYCIAIAYTAEGLNVMAMDTSYTVVAETSRWVDLHPMTEQERLQTIFESVDEILVQTSDLKGDCLGLAVADPGVIDHEAGIAKWSSILQHWHNVPIVDIFQKRFQLPVLLLNGASTYIRAIDRLEIREEFDNMFFVQFGAGIGCCFKLGGIYISGNAMLAGEFGHWKVTDEPVQCRCGGVGCLEALAALPAIANNARSALQHGSESVLADLESFTGYDVLDAAAQGDRLSFRIVCEAFDQLGQAIGGLINTLAPEVVLIEEVVGRAGPDAVASLFQSIKRNILPSHSEHLSLRISTVESQLSRIACLGAAVTTLDTCFEYDSN